MRATTVQLLRLLQAAAPSRVFDVRVASSEASDDVIKLANDHWLLIDSHDDPPMRPPMVHLMDGDPETGGQIAFWVIRSQDVLPSVVLSALKV